MPIQWEYLGQETLPPGKFAPTKVDIWRAKVPGGWLTLTSKGTNTETLAMAFYPDPQHEWDGNTLP